ncbi:unnamed protein product [Amoebophrya sp. A25]|nr:unnamed protein product [Amoebophrya sp. A25]|eukprot:GSA25T00016493001.1
MSASSSAFSFANVGSAPSTSSEQVRGSTGVFGNIDDLSTASILDRLRNAETTSSGPAQSGSDHSPRLLRSGVFVDYNEDQGVGDVDMASAVANEGREVHHTSTFGQMKQGINNVEDVVHRAATTGGFDSRTEARKLLQNWLQCEEEAAEITKKTGANSQWPSGSCSLISAPTAPSSSSLMFCTTSSTSLLGGAGSSSSGTTFGTSSSSSSSAFRKSIDEEENISSKSSSTSTGLFKWDRMASGPQDPLRASTTKRPLTPGRTKRPASALDANAIHTVLRDKSATLSADFEEDLAVAMNAIERVNAERRNAAQTSERSAPLQTAVDRVKDVDPRLMMEERHRMIQEKRQERKRGSATFFPGVLPPVVAGGGNVASSTRGRGGSTSSTIKSSSSTSIWTTPAPIEQRGSKRRTAAGSNTNQRNQNGEISSAAGRPLSASSPLGRPGENGARHEASHPLSQQHPFCSTAASTCSGNGTLNFSPTTCDASDAGTATESQSFFDEHNFDLASVSTAEDALAQREAELKKAKTTLRRETDAYKSLLTAKEKEARAVVEKAKIDDQLSQLRSKQDAERRKQDAETAKRRDFGCKRVVASTAFIVSQLSKRHRSWAFARLKAAHEEVQNRLRRALRARNLELQRSAWHVWLRSVQLVQAERAEEAWFLEMARAKALEARAKEFAFKKSAGRCVRAWTIWAREASHLRALDNLKEKTRKFLQLRNAGNVEAMVGEHVHDSGGTGANRSRNRRAPGTADHGNVDGMHRDIRSTPGTDTAASQNPYAVRYPARCVSQAGGATTPTSSLGRSPNAQRFENSPTSEISGSAAARSNRRRTTTSRTQNTKACSNYDNNHNSTSTSVISGLVETPASASSNSVTGAVVKRSKLVTQMEKRAEERRQRHEILENRKREAEEQKRQLERQREAEELEREAAEKRQRIRDAQLKQKQEAEFRERQEAEKALRRKQMREARQWHDFSLIRKSFENLDRMWRKMTETTQIAARFHVETRLFNVVVAWNQTAVRSRSARESAEAAQNAKADRLRVRLARETVTAVLQCNLRAARAEGAELYHKVLARKFVETWRWHARQLALQKQAKAHSAYCKHLLARVMPIWLSGVEECRVERHKERLMSKVNSWLTEIEADVDTEYQMKFADPIANPSSSTS